MLVTILHFIVIYYFAVVIYFFSFSVVQVTNLVGLSALARVRSVTK